MTTIFFVGRCHRRHSFLVVLNCIIQSSPEIYFILEEKKFSNLVKKLKRMNKQRWTEESQSKLTAHEFNSIDASHVLPIDQPIALVRSKVTFNNHPSESWSRSRGSDYTTHHTHLQISNSDRAVHANFRLTIIHPNLNSHQKQKYGSQSSLLDWLWYVPLFHLPLLLPASSPHISLCPLSFD